MKIRNILLVYISTVLLACPNTTNLPENFKDSNLDPVSYLLMPFGKIENVRASSGEKGLINISWERQAKADAYVVERATEIEGNYEVVASKVLGLSWSDTGITEMGSDNKYYYRVKGVLLDWKKAVKASGPYSVPAEGYCIDPASDFNVLVENIQVNYNFDNPQQIVNFLEITWDEEEFANPKDRKVEYYKILRAVDNAGTPGDFSFLKNEAGYDVTGLKSPIYDYYTEPGTKYHYKIVPCKIDPVLNREISASPQPEVPVNITTLIRPSAVRPTVGTNPGTPSLEIEWDDYPNKYKYYLYKSNELGGDQTLIYEGGDLNFPDTDITAGSQYFYGLSVSFMIYIGTDSYEVKTPIPMPVPAMYNAPPEHVEDPILGEGKDSVTLKWKRAEGQADSPYYNLFYSTQQDTGFKLVETQIKDGKPGLSYDEGTKTFTYNFTNTTIPSGYVYFRIHNLNAEEVQSSQYLPLTGYFLPENPNNFLASGGMGETPAGDFVELTWENPGDEGIEKFIVYKRPVIFNKEQDGGKTWVKILRREFSSTIPFTLAPIAGHPEFAFVGEVTNDGSNYFTLTDSSLRPGLHEYIITSHSAGLEAVTAGYTRYLKDDGHRTISDKEFIQETNKFFRFAITTIENGDNGNELESPISVEQRDGEDTPTGGFFSHDIDTKIGSTFRQKYYLNDYNTGYLTLNTPDFSALPGDDLHSSESGQNSFDPHSLSTVAFLDDHGRNGITGHPKRDSMRVGRIQVSGLYQGEVVYKIGRNWWARHNAQGCGKADYGTTANVSDIYGGDRDQGYFDVKQAGASDFTRIGYEDGMSATYENSNESTYNNAINAQEQMVEPFYNADQPYYPVWN
ncbi:MAG: hypothetical protein JXR63_11110 [Spirochaetales bacterium]|nr:hypothetical protein [Spirochaetales bacterium]